MAASAASKALRRTPAIWISLALGCGGVEGEGRARDVAPGPARPPSVILVSLDTTRADHLGVYGQRRPLTPNLDALVEEGEALLFERAYSVASWTLPSHMTMFTGLYPEQHGVHAPNRALSRDVPTMAERLSDRGYATFGLHGGGWIDARHGFSRGFDVFQAHEDGEQAIDDARAVLGDHLEQEPDRPFFLFLHFFDAHTAPVRKGQHALLYDPPAEFRERFAPGAAELFEPGDGQALLDGLIQPSRKQRKGLESLYAAGVAYLDDVMGRLISEWRSRGLLEHTWLVVTADHGEVYGDRFTAYTSHGSLWEDGLRIPMLVRPPGGAGGVQRVERPVSLVDLAPSIEAWTGGAGEAYWPGRTLVGGARATELDPDGAERVLGAQEESQFALMRWPLKVQGAQGSPNVRVYDLWLDPEQVWPEPDPARARALGGELRSSFERGLSALAPLPGDGPGTVGPLDRAQRQRLEALGYFDRVEAEDGQD
jgi:arylsulfatase A-like enzyme